MSASEKRRGRPPKEFEPGHEGEKQCRACGEWWPLAEFYPDPDHAFGVTAECRGCVAITCHRYYRYHRGQRLRAMRRYQAPARARRRAEKWARERRIRLDLRERTARLRELRRAGRAARRARMAAANAPRPEPDEGP